MLKSVWNVSFQLPLKVSQNIIEVIQRLSQHNRATADEKIVLLFQFLANERKHIVYDSLYVEHAENYVKMSMLSENHLKELSKLLSLVYSLKTDFE